METALHLFLGIEGLYDAEAAECLLDIGHERPPLVLGLERTALEAFTDTPHHHAGQRQKYEHEQRKLP